MVPAAKAFENTSRTLLESFFVMFLPSSGVRLRAVDRPGQRTIVLQPRGLICDGRGLIRHVQRGS